MNETATLYLILESFKVSCSGTVHEFPAVCGCGLFELCNVPGYLIYLVIKPSQVVSVKGKKLWIAARLH